MHIRACVSSSPSKKWLTPFFYPLSIRQISLAHKSNQPRHFYKSVNFLVKDHGKNKEQIAQSFQSSGGFEVIRARTEELREGANTAIIFFRTEVELEDEREEPRKLALISKSI